jgi:type IV pilus assembly protein PilV
VTSRGFDVNSPIKRKTQRGTTLVETLVALVVLSVGLLGIAALQMTSLRNNRGAHLRSQAQVMAYDITDRMRANRAAAMLNAYVIGMSATPTGTGVALTDLQQWRATLSATLPGGDGWIRRDGDMFEIRIQWTDPLGTQFFDTRTRI